PTDSIHGQPEARSRPYLPAETRATAGCRRIRRGPAPQRPSAGWPGPFRLHVLALGREAAVLRRGSRPLRVPGWRNDDGLRAAARTGPEGRAACRDDDRAGLLRGRGGRALTKRQEAARRHPLRPPGALPARAG